MKGETKEWLTTYVVVTVGLLMSGMMGYDVGRHRKSPPTDLGPTLARLERLEEWAKERERTYSKCIAVERMDLTIYPVPNVGVRKVKP